MDLFATYKAKERITAEKAFHAKIIGGLTQIPH